MEPVLRDEETTFSVRPIFFVTIAALKNMDRVTRVTIFFVVKLWPLSSPP